MRLSSYFKSISRILILAMLHLCWLTSYGYAEMIPTESAVQIQDDRQSILDLLDRQETMDELEKYGISKMEATTRINSLTDEEVTEIAGKLDELPAGGVCVRTPSYTSPGCDSDNGGVLLAILLGVLALLVFIYYLIRTKDKVDYPSSNEGPASEPVVEEVCDPGMESCPGI